jgi:hypothetical protein
VDTDGSDIRIYCGAGNGTGSGGSFRLYAGDTDTGLGGSFSIRAGDINTSGGQGGSVAITGGRGFVDGASSGDVSITGGSTTDLEAGAANVEGGASDSGNGGEAVIVGGATTSGTSGDVVLDAGPVLGAGTKGRIRIAAFPQTSSIEIGNAIDNPPTTFKSNSNILYFQGTENWNMRMQTTTLAFSRNFSISAGQGRIGEGGMFVSVEAGEAGNASEPGDVGATGNDATHVNLASSTVTEDDFYNGMDVEIVAGTGSGQTRTILDYVGSTKIAEVTVAWGTIPDGTSDYVIHTKAAAKDGRPLSYETSGGGNAGTVAGETAGEGGYMVFRSGNGGAAATSTNGAAIGGPALFKAGIGGTGNATFASGRGGHMYFSGGNGGSLGGGTVGGIGGSAYLAGGESSGTSDSGDVHIGGGDAQDSGANGAVYLGSVWSNSEPGGISTQKGKTSAIYIGNTTDRPDTTVYGHMAFEAFNNAGGDTTTDVGLAIPVFSGTPTRTNSMLTGDLVWDSSANNLYGYNGASWTLVGGGGSTAGLNSNYQLGGAENTISLDDGSGTIIFSDGGKTDDIATRYNDTMMATFGTGSDGRIWNDGSGSFYIRTANSATAAITDEIHIITGQADGTGSTNAATFQTGIQNNATLNSASTGEIIVRSGWIVNSSGTTGNVSVQSGGIVAGGGSSGTTKVFSGDILAGNGASGAVSLYSGTTPVGGSGNTGAVGVYSGNALGTGDAGDVDIYAGSVATGTAGFVTITGGASTGVATNGGNVRIRGGSSTGGTSGQVYLGDINTSKINFSAPTTMPTGEAQASLNVFTVTGISGGAPTGAAPDGSFAYDEDNDLFYGRVAGSWTQMTTGSSGLNSNYQTGDNNIAISAANGEIVLDNSGDSNNAMRFEDEMYLYFGTTFPVSIRAALGDEGDFDILGTTPAAGDNGRNWDWDVADGAVGTAGFAGGGGGTFNLRSGDGGNGHAVGGNPGTGGTLSLVGGTGGDAATDQNGATGATINLQGGSGGTGDGTGSGGAGGNVNISAGSVGTGGSGTSFTGGSAVIGGGDSTSASDGGLALIVGGDIGSAGTGDPGDAKMWGGRVSATANPAGGKCGDAYLEGGTSTSSAAVNGGHSYVRGGNASGGGTDGDVIVGDANTTKIEMSSDLHLELSTDEIQLGATGPTSGGNAKITWKDAAPVGAEANYGRGTLWIDMANGFLYINTGDNSSATWVKVGQQT